MQFIGNGRQLDPERIAFKGEDNGSNYTQPPVLALAVAETFESTAEQNLPQAKLFLYEMYPSLKRFYEYFETYRSNSARNKLIGVIHPHETGRDSDPTFDQIKPLRLKRNGVDTPRTTDLINVPIDYLSVLAYGVKLKRDNGDLSKTRKRFWINDVMMNCIYVDNLYQMSKLAGIQGLERDSEYFSKLAETVEEQIMSKMWFPNARSGQGAFYALNKTGSPINEISISNLFPLVLPNISEYQLRSLLDMMDRSFNTPYPLPSVATDSPNYDPHNREIDRLWRGPTWINTNWYIVERGLKIQLSRSDIDNTNLLDRVQTWESRIIDSSRALLDKSGLAEHYDPITGAGQRKRVKNFAWSNLGYMMLKSS